ncbi:MAG: outer membrane protein transport protein, partial [Syntrophales bacterium]|nr:outer membrane protein transport protein [Syntrophales bacterium]
MALNIKKIIFLVVICTIPGIFAATLGLNKPAYAGNGFYPLGFGARVTGRGGADIAVADDTLSISLNPAGMTRIKGEKLDLSGSAGVGFTHFQNDFNDTDGDPFYFLLPGIGYVNNREDKPLAYGIAFYAPGGLGTSYSLRHPLYENELDYKDLIVSLRLSPAIAYRVTPRLSVGFAPYLSYTRLDVKGPFFKSKDEVANIYKGDISGSGLTYGTFLAGLADEYTVLSELKAIDALGYGFSFGILYEVKPQLTVGFSYVSRQ